MADRGPALGAPTEEWRGLSRYGMHLHPHLCRNRANAAARHRRAGSFFRRRRKPPWKSIAPNSPSHDRLLRSHVFHPVPTYALLLAGLRATSVGSVPVEVVSSDAWIARPSRKQHLSITRPHAVGALGETSCTSFSISADLIANVNQLFHEARLIGASGDRSRAPPPHLARPPAARPVCSCGQQLQPPHQRLHRGTDAPESHCCIAILFPAAVLTGPHRLQVLSFWIVDGHHGLSSRPRIRQAAARFRHACRPCTDRALPVQT